jgi:hypothetical protein
MLDASQTAGADAPIQVPAGLWVVVALAAVVAVGVLVRGLEQGSRRDRAIARLAAARGWRYQADDPAGIGRLRCATFAGGIGVHVTNVVTLGPQNGETRGFDYSLLVERTDRRDGSPFGTTTRGAAVGILRELAFDSDDSPAKTTREPTRRRSGAVVRIDAFCPPLHVMPAGLLSRMVEVAGAADLDFESVAFNRGWDVRCTDRRFAWLFCDASMIDLILGLGGGTSVEVFGNYVVVSRDLLTDPEDVMAFVDAVARVPEALNPLVRAEYPAAGAIEERGALDEWSRRPDGRKGRY